MKRLLLFAVSLFACATFAREAWHDITTPDDERPNPARIQEIAAWLPEKPRATAPAITDRAAWDKVAQMEGAKDIIARAERVAKDPIPVLGDYKEFMRNGNRSRYEKQYFQRVTTLANLVQAECLENKGRFLKKIEEYLQAFCEERSWSSPAWDRSFTNWDGSCLHGDLGSTDRAFLLATTVYLLEAKLPAELVARVKSECRRRILSNFMAKNNGTMKFPDAVSGNWWIHARENWNAVCNANILKAALTIVESREERAAFVEAAERTAKYFLESILPDGYCTEGIGYWNYGFGHHVTMGLAIRDATGGKVDIFAHPRNRKSVEYAYGFQLEKGLSPHFADGGGSPYSQTLALCRQIWPDLANTAALEAPLVSRDLSAMMLRAFGQEPPRGKPTMDVLPVRSWFPSSQVLISRLDPDVLRKNRKMPAFAIGIKGGHNQELHNHNDLGSYSISLAGKIFTGDPGGTVYTRMTFHPATRYLSDIINSYGHPVPLVDGKRQSFGRRYAAQVLATSFTADRDELQLDITKAYAVTGLVSLVRTMTFDRKANAIEIRDKVAFAEPKTFESPVITYANVLADYEKGVYRLEMPDSKSKLAVKFSATGGDWSVKSTLVENPLRKSPVRLACTFDAPVKEAEISYRFTIE